MVSPLHNKVVSIVCNCTLAEAPSVVPSEEQFKDIAKIEEAVTKCVDKVLTQLAVHKRAVVRKCETPLFTCVISEGGALKLLEIALREKNLAHEKIKRTARIDLAGDAEFTIVATEEKAQEKQK